MRFAAVRRSPLAFGLLSHHDIDDLARQWVKPALADPAVREEIRRFIVSLDAAVTRDAARRIAGFDRPVLFAWGVDDVLFPITHAHRMAAIVPDGRVEAITGSRTLPMLDKPERLAELVAAFARHPEPVAV
jgi:pimeloyl-ACP methyl ester carboxylesterase